MKRYMPATGRASLLISERTVIRQMMNLKFYNVPHKAINTRISVIPYSFTIKRMNDAFWLVTTCKVIQDSLDSFVGILAGFNTVDLGF